MSKHVDDTLARASRDIVQRYHVGMIAMPEFPDTFAGIVNFYRKHGAIAVGNKWTPDRWMGDLESAQAFEAWHDWSHIKTGGQFTREGEERVNELQQAQLMEWWQDNRESVTLPAIRRASATLDMHNIGRLVHWAQWGGPPEHAKSFADGYLAALGMADKVPLAHHNKAIDLRNEWTRYVSPKPPYRDLPRGKSDMHDL